MLSLAKRKYVDLGQKIYVDLGQKKNKYMKEMKI
jgi:hypothetical protein